MSRLIPSTLYGDEDEKTPDRGSLAGAAALNVGKSVLTDVVAPAAELVQEVTGNKDNLYGEGAKAARATADAVESEIPEERRKDRDAAFIPEDGQRSVAKNPFSTGVMKLSGAVPLIGAGIAAGPAAPAVFAAQAAGSRMSDIHGEMDKTSDEDLVKKYPRFDYYLSNGMPPSEARKLLADDMIHDASMLPTMAGAALGGGAISGAIRHTVGRGIIKGALIGAGEGLAGGAAMGAGSDATTQMGDMAGGSQANYDIGRTVRAGTNAGLEMLALGAGTGSIGGLRSKASDWAAKRLDEKTAREKQVDGNQPDPAQDAAITSGEAPQSQETTALDQQIAAANASDPNAAPNSQTAPASDATAQTVAPGASPTAPARPMPPAKEVVDAIHEAATKRTKATDIHDALVAKLGEAAPDTATETVGILGQLKAAGEIDKNRGGYKSTRKPPPITKAEAVEVAKPPEAVEPPAPNVPGDQPSPVAATVGEAVAPDAVTPAVTTAATSTVTPGGNVPRLKTTRGTKDIPPPLTLEDPATKLAALKAKADALGQAVIDKGKDPKATTDEINAAWAAAEAAENAHLDYASANNLKLEPTVVEAPKNATEIKTKVAAKKAPKKVVVFEKKAPADATTAKAEAEADAPLRQKIAEKMSSPALPATVGDKPRPARPAVVVEPDAHSVGEVLERVKRNLAREDKVAADEKAANAKARAEGKSVVLRAAEAPEAREARLERHIKNAVDEHRSAEAAKKLKQRAKVTDANEHEAEKVARDIWADENGEHNPAREKELRDVEDKALNGDPKGITALAHRARNMLITAANEGVKVLKTAKNAAGDRNPTPWRTYLNESHKFIDWLNNHARDAKPGEVKDRVRDFVHMERNMRAGDVDEAHTRRIEKNDERTSAEAAKKLSRGGQTVSDAASKMVDTKTADIQNDMADKIDANAPIRPVGRPADTVTSELHTDDFARRGHALVHDIQAGKIEGLHSTTLEDQLSKTKSPGGGLADKGLGAAVRRKLIELGGKTNVHIVPDAAWEAHGLGKVGGFQIGRADPTKPAMIVIPARYAANGRVWFHEGVHAITEHGINNNLELQADIRKLMDDVMRSREGGHDYERLWKDYGLTTEHEFVAEVLSNPTFRDMLRATTLDRPQVTRWGTARTAWDKFIHIMFKLLGLQSKDQFNALDHALRASGEALDSQKKIIDQTNAVKRVGEQMASAQPSVRPSARDYFEERVPAKIDWKLRQQRWLDKVATVMQMTNNSDHLYGPDRPARKLAEAMGRMATQKDAILRERAEPLVKEMSRLQRKYDQRTDGKSTWTEFASLIHDATVAGVHPDQPIGSQFKKENPGNWYQHAAHKDLSARWSKLPGDLQSLFKETTGYFRETQNKMSLGLIKNALRAASPDGKGSDALAQRIFDKKLTDADKTVLGKDGLLTSIEKAGALSRIKGPYVPLMRRGDYVITGRHEVEAPAGARRLDEQENVAPKGNTYEFKTEQEAKDFVQKNLAKHGINPSESRVAHVDPQTESEYRIDANGKRVRLTKEETNTDDRWRVTIDPKHVEFHERASDASEARKNLVDSGMRDVSSVDARKLTPDALNDSMMPTQISRMLNALQKREGFKKLDARSQDELVRQLKEAGIASMSTTRAQSHRLPRKNISGYSEDLLKNTGTYAQSTAGYLARLKHRPDIDAALKQMEDYTDRMTHAGNDDYTTALRRQRLNELTRRAHSVNSTASDHVLNRAVSRVLQMSYLDKLGSPAFHMINSTEPWTISMPVLAAKHGLFRTVGALGSAYRLIGGMHIVGAGLRDTGRAIKGHEADLTDYRSTLRDRVAKDAVDGQGLVKLLDHLHDVGLMSRDAGMELARVTSPSSNILGRGLDKTDLMARQLGTAIESINRGVTAIAAYKLARAKGETHAEAMEHATETVHDTMKDYSAWNAAPMFNHPVGRVALQFKKYAQGTYYLLGKQAVAAFKGDPQAMKAFAGLMATHMLTAGVLGLPLEAIRVGMLGANLSGLVSTTYDDLEQGVRKGAANVLGKDGGEIFSRGAARWLGIDLSSRISFNSLLTSGQDPKSMKQDDLYAYLAKNFAGAPTSLILDAVAGFQAIGKGDIEEGARLLVPLKVFADTIQAHQWATVGKKSPSGKTQMEPVGLGDAFIKSMGFQPGSIAERNEGVFAVRHNQQNFSAMRTKLQNDWVNASQSEKTAMWREITKWNAEQPPAAQIKLADLMGLKRRRDREATSQDHLNGITTSKRDRHLRAGADAYNN